MVVNLAAVHRDDVRDKSEYQRTNIDGAENVALVCKEKGIKKIVFTSTVAVYGFAEPGTDESGAINPFNEYGRTKFEAEEKLRKWDGKGENSLIIVRPTVIFGEGMSAKSSLDNFRPPFLLSDGVERTLRSEFIASDPNREIFFAE